jgi:hypothetical protein
MEASRREAEALALADPKKRKGAGGAVPSDRTAEKAGRLTGFQQFSDKTGMLNLEAMEAAAENAQIDEDEEQDEGNLEDVDEDLFDDDDDLDDLEFDDDDDEDDDGDDDDDDEPDI